MRILLTIWVGMAGLCSMAEAVSIPATEAGGHIGEEATVTGRVVRIATLSSSSNRPTILDLDRPYPDAAFQVVVFEKDLAAFGGDLKGAYEGKTIAVTGKITRFRETPQMVVSGPDQIRLSEAGEAPAKEEPDVAADPAPLTPKTALLTGQPSSAVRGPGTERSGLPPNLLKNGDFSKGKTAWDMDRGVEVAETEGRPALKIKLSPDRVVRVTQKLGAGVPRDARQFQALVQVRPSPETRLDKPEVTLRFGSSMETAAALPRKVRSGGAWHEIKWTRTADFQGISPLMFGIEAGPGEGEIWVDDVYLFAHPDYKDKTTWKVSDG